MGVLVLGIIILIDSAVLLVAGIKIGAAFYAIGGLLISYFGFKRIKNGEKELEPEVPKDTPSA